VAKKPNILIIWERLHVFSPWIAKTSLFERAAKRRSSTRHGQRSTALRSFVETGLV
jgi:hypothetical protein